MQMPGAYGTMKSRCAAPLCRLAINIILGEETKALACTVPVPNIFYLILSVIKDLFLPPPAAGAGPHPPLPCKKALLLSSLRTRNNDLWWSRSRKYYFSVVKGQKI